MSINSECICNCSDMRKPIKKQTSHAHITTIFFYPEEMSVEIHVPKNKLNS